MFDRALVVLRAHGSWGAIAEAQRTIVERPLVEGRGAAKPGTSIPQLRSLAEACGPRLAAAISELHHLVDGARLASVDLGNDFAGGIETGGSS